MAITVTAQGIASLDRTHIIFDITIHIHPAIGRGDINIMVISHPVYDMVTYPLPMKG